MFLVFDIFLPWWTLVDGSSVFCDCLGREPRPISMIALWVFRNTIAPVPVHAWSSECFPPILILVEIDFWRWKHERGCFYRVFQIIFIREKVSLLRALNGNNSKLYNDMYTIWYQSKRKSVSWIHLNDGVTLIYVTWESLVFFVVKLKAEVYPLKSLVSILTIFLEI